MKIEKKKRNNFVRLRFFPPPRSALRSCSDVSPPGHVKVTSQKGSCKVHSHILGNAIVHSRWQKLVGNELHGGTDDPFVIREENRLLDALRVIFVSRKEKKRKKDPAVRARFAHRWFSRDGGVCEGKTRREMIVWITHESRPHVRGGGGGGSQTGRDAGKRPMSV